MAIEIIDGGAVIACATLVVPRLVGDPITAYGARGLKGLRSANPNAVIVELDQPIDILSVKILTTLGFGFGSVIPEKPIAVSAFPTGEIAIQLNGDSRDCQVHLLVLQIAGPVIQGVNTIVPP